MIDNAMFSALENSNCIWVFSALWTLHFANKIVCFNFNSVLIYKKIYFGSVNAKCCFVNYTYRLFLIMLNNKYN